MVQHTRQYEEEHDDWKEFRDTFLRREGEGCGWRDVLHSFKAWHKEHVGDKPPGEREIKTYFEKHLGPEKNNKVNKKPLRGFKGWKLIATPADTQLGPLGQLVTGYRKVTRLFWLSTPGEGSLRRKPPGYRFLVTWPGSVL